MAPALEAYSLVVTTVPSFGLLPASWHLHTSRGFLDDATDVSLAVPDGSELAGWPTIQPTGRVRFTYSVEARTGDAIDQLMQSSPTKETIIRTTGRYEEGELAYSGVD